MLLGSAYGIVNGVGNLVAGFMPVAMGGLMKTHVAGGFVLLVASQALVAVGGLWLSLRQKIPALGDAQRAAGYRPPR